MPEPLTDARRDDLGEITDRAACAMAQVPNRAFTATRVLRTDVPALIAEVRRLRAALRVADSWYRHEPVYSYREAADAVALALREAPDQPHPDA